MAFHSQDHIGALLPPHRSPPLSPPRVMSELFSHLITKVRHSLVDRPITAAERQRARALLPEPMIPGNYEAASTRCFIARAFTRSVVSNEGFEWLNEAKSTEQRPKWGYVSTVPGSEIRFRVDTRATSSISSSSAIPSTLEGTHSHCAEMVFLPLKIQCFHVSSSVHI